MKNKMLAFKKEKGTTLVEIMLSVALLAIIVTPLLGAVYCAVKNNTAAKDKTEAIALAEKVMGEIKASKIIGVGSGDTQAAENGLVASYVITSDVTGEVTPATSSEDISAYTYNATAANNADFILEITQGDLSDGKVYVTFKDSSEKTIGTPLMEMLVATESLELEVNQSTNLYGFKTTEASGSFLDPNNIKLKVKYTEAKPSRQERLKINTVVVASDPNNTHNSNIFKVYVINNEEVNSGVKFINRGKTDFEVIYIDTNNIFKYDSELNKLFKITVTIKKNGKPIYNTSSYVKK